MTQKEAEAFGKLTGAILGGLIGFFIAAFIVAAVVYFAWNYAITQIWNNLPNLSFVQCYLIFLFLYFIKTFFKSPNK